MDMIEVYVIEEWDLNADDSKMIVYRYGKSKISAAMLTPEFLKEESCINYLDTYTPTHFSSITEFIIKSNVIQQTDSEPLYLDIHEEDVYLNQDMIYTYFIEQE